MSLIMKLTIQDDLVATLEKSSNQYATTNVDVDKYKSNTSDPTLVSWDVVVMQLLLLKTLFVIMMQQWQLVVVHK